MKTLPLKKTMYQLSFLKKVLIALAVLILLPILRIVGVIGKGLSLTIYFVVLVVLILYGVYQLYYKSLNRDENDFNKFNFGKPDEKQVLMSRLNSRMSEADRQRCMEMEEVGGDLNPDSLIIPKHKIDEWKVIHVDLRYLKKKMLLHQQQIQQNRQEGSSPRLNFRIYIK